MKLDPSTLSNYTKVSLRSTAVRLKVNWPTKTLSGSVKYQFDSIVNAEVVLDTSFLDVNSVVFNGQPVKYSISARQEPLGAPLVICLPESALSGDLDIEFATTEKCTALQWLDPEQTSGKKAPYMFSQCQSIHARSLFPCFDTPSVKSTYDIQVESAHPTVATGNVVKSDEEGVYKFRQNIPIPSYLFAISSGDLASAPIGPRSLVYSEPSDLKACQYEFEADTENFIKVAEKIVFPYEWETYNVLVLPPSFPFGGMENPNITFATPTLVSGDRQLVEVIAHELAHSWSGNLVTNCSWEHFWLNEGWTVYLERRIMGALRGESYRHFEAIIGWKDLTEAIDAMGETAEKFSKMVVDLQGNVDPDDAFSTVPYEKGSTFLLYLENLLGRGEWDKFIPFYFSKFKAKSLDTDMFKETLYEFFASQKDKLDAIDWNLWLHTPGLPPKPDFDTSIAEPCFDLAAKYAEAAKSTGDFSWATQKDTEGWKARQVLVFLDSVAEKLEGAKHISSAAEKMNELFNFSTSNNAEIKARWFRLAIAGKLEQEYQPLADWLGTVGRMKFTRPGYRNLASVSRQLALDTFAKYKDFYHPICRTMVMKDLGL
ncbi:Leukotriene A-4 hydrolase [Wickerhamiella sorbophila]|uniref:Leukotriene A(4) hydrolase n=1 Tax=Wickerhamiella sorbophila TaxID=45607 RepID=A0A2T0FE94_9ASCO|nr:Leukotriene A-4 hydrolase [Wickerhamiella sorbophila]PRT53290.1 Leukotriene A-4 hydrolase [Wickerhamiella sorbophila]